jgi:putative intracellular protease/amidase
MKILFIVTSANLLAGSPTGIWFEELATPYYILQNAGYEVEIASPKGGEVPFDPRALDPKEITESVKKFRVDEVAMQKFNNSKKISGVDFTDYKAIFFPGGHGAVVDLPKDEILAAKLGDYFESGNLVAAICHGQGGLVRANKKNGKSIIDGLKLTSFSNAEENAIGVSKKVPFLLQSKLEKLGGIYSSADNFKEYVVVDKNLITGQNPASSKKVAEEILKAVQNVKKN